MSAKRFRIALSFPGEKRDFVQQVADSLSSVLGKESVLYDHYLTAELARPDLDLYLGALYREQSELLVPFFCADYERKKWCKLEWRQMRDILFNIEEHRIMPFRFDDAPIAGVLSIDGYVKIGNRTPHEVAGLILQRLDKPEPQIASDNPHLALHLPDVLDLEVETLISKPSLPESVKVHVWEPTRTSDGGLRLNLALRWGLNRRPGVVILRSGELDRVFNSFIEAENFFREAVQCVDNAELFLPRVWFRIEELPSAKADKSRWLAALAERHKVSREEWGRLESATGSLGVMFRADAAVASPQRMREFISSIASLFNQTTNLEPLLVIHADTTTTTALAAKLATLCGSATGLPGEILEVLPEPCRPHLAPPRGSSWMSPLAPGHALLRFCQQLDPDESCLRRREFKELNQALGRFDRATLALEKGEDGSLPRVEDIAADLDRIESNKVEAIRLLLKLTKSHVVLRMMLPELVAEMAAMEPPMRAAALEAAVPEFDLVEAWLAGLTPTTRLSIPAWWVSASPGHLESVLAALIRAAKRGDEEAERIAKEWLPSVSPRLREAAQSVLDNAVDSSKSFWESEPKGKALLFLGECDPAMEIPIDRVAPILLTRPEFWQLVQRLPLTIDLIRRLVHLPKKYRAVIGLCSANEWTTLKDGHVLPQVFNWRGCPQPSQHGIESL